jgi:hypothetical protein
MPNYCKTDLKSLSISTGLSSTFFSSFFTSSFLSGSLEAAFEPLKTSLIFSCHFYASIPKGFPSFYSRVFLSGAFKNVSRDPNPSNRLGLTTSSLFLFPKSSKGFWPPNVAFSGSGSFSASYLILFQEIRFPYGYLNSQLVFLSNRENLETSSGSVKFSLTYFSFG